MMRLLYICRCCSSLNTGINKKISAQVDNLVKQGVNATIISICAENNHQKLNQRIQQIQILGNELPSGVIGKIKREFQINKVINDIIRTSNDCDIIYLRIRYPSLQLYKMFSQPRKCKIVIEYQAIEPREYRLKKKYWYLPMDVLFGSSIRKYTDAIVGVTNEITQYQLKRSGDPNKPHITIGNGFDVASVPIRTSPPYGGQELHLLCVAIFHRAHGLDRLLHGISAYADSKKIVLHLVGNGDEINNLLYLAKRLGISDNVVYHGFLKERLLDDIFNLCHVGIGTLGLHRNGLSEGSILKAREYCARGIPFLYDAFDHDFPPDFPYIFQLPADESPIDIGQVIAFAEDVLAEPEHPRQMRRYAAEHLDWSVKMKKLKDFLETLG